MIKTVMPLGTSGWMPTATRQTMCFAFETDNELIFFDLGTGVSRLASDIGQQLLDRHQQVTILLSHYHLDHIAGLPYLPRFLAGKHVIMAGPGLEIYGMTIDRILSRICSSPIFSLQLTEFPMDIRLQELTPGLNNVGNLEVSTRLQAHSDPSLGLRVMDVAYVTDTRVSIESIELFRNCSVLIHEAMLDSDGYAEATMNEASDIDHSDANGAARLANESSAKMLILAHVNPSYSNERLANMLEEAKQIFPSTYLAEDLTAVTI